MFLSWEPIIAIGLAYLVGSISTAIVVCKIMQLPDPRMQGSKNPGATNVLRFGGKKAAILTLLGDTAKGVLPVLIGKLCGFSHDVLALVALAAFLGHLYPLYFGFKGGKGVATAFGTLLVLCWPIGLGVLITWLTVALTTRYSSLAALISVFAAPLLTQYFAPEFNVVISLMSLFLLLRHHTNIQNLITGKESKIGSK